MSHSVAWKLHRHGQVTENSRQIMDLLQQLHSRPDLTAFGKGLQWQELSWGEEQQLVAPAGRGLEKTTVVLQRGQQKASRPNEPLPKNQWVVCDFLKMPNNPLNECVLAAVWTCGETHYRSFVCSQWNICWSQQQAQQHPGTLCNFTKCKV